MNRPKEFVYQLVDDVLEEHNNTFCLAGEEMPHRDGVKTTRQFTQLTVSRKLFSISQQSKQKMDENDNLM